MSSYVESAYSIERRRLQGIVSQCERELADALGAVSAKISEPGYKRTLFEKRRMEGSREQKEKKESEGRYRSVLEQELCERCDRILKQYEKEMDDKTEQQIRRVKQYVVQSGETEEILRDRIDRLEQQIMEGMYHTATREEERDHFEKKSVQRRTVTHSKKGKNLSRFHVQTEEGHVPDKDETEAFDKMLEELKEQVKGQSADVLHLIETEYKRQPDFAKKLYRQRVFPKLQELRQELVRHRETKRQKDSEIEVLKLRYEAAARLLGMFSPESPAGLQELDGMPPKLLRSQCEKMERAFIEKRKQEYAFAAIRKVMEKHGITCFRMGNAGADIQNVSYDEHVAFHISGISQNRFVAEMAGKYTGSSPTLEERRKSVSSAKKACEFIRCIHEELERDYGIIFETSEVIPPSEQTLEMVKTSTEQDGKSGYRTGAGKRMSLEETE